MKVDLVGVARPVLAGAVAPNATEEITSRWEIAEAKIVPAENAAERHQVKMVASNERRRQRW